MSQILETLEVPYLKTLHFMMGNPCRIVGTQVCDIDSRAFKASFEVENSVLFHAACGCVW